MKTIYAFPLILGLLLGTSLAFLGCDGDSSVPEGADTYTQGDCKYADSNTDHAGQPKAAEEPAPQEKPMQMEIAVSGMGSLSGLKPECSLEGASGNFTGLLSGQGEVNDNGGYFAGFVFADGSFTTPSGCKIPTVSVGSMTEVVVRAKLSNTQKNCKSYCEAKARQSAESECGASSSSASCRTQAEGEYAATCEQKCTGSTTRRIVAESRLGAQALAQLNAQSLGLNGLGTIEANLTFDRIEDSNGSVVSEQ